MVESRSTPSRRPSRRRLFVRRRPGPRGRGCSPNARQRFLAAAKRGRPQSGRVLPHARAPGSGWLAGPLVDRCAPAPGRGLCGWRDPAAPPSDGLRMPDPPPGPPCFSTAPPPGRPGGGAFFLRPCHQASLKRSARGVRFVARCRAARPSGTARRGQAASGRSGGRCSGRGSARCRRRIRSSMTFAGRGLCPVGSETTGRVRYRRSISSPFVVGFRAAPHPGLSGGAIELACRRALLQGVPGRCPRSAASSRERGRRWAGSRSSCDRRSSSR